MGSHDDHHHAGKRLARRAQKSHKCGGLGLGTTGTSSTFLGGILALVADLTVTKKDQAPVPAQATWVQRTRLQ